MNDQAPAPRAPAARSSAELVVRAVAYTDPVVRTLDAEAQQEYVRRYGGPDSSPMDPADFAAPSGAFLVAFAGPDPAAIGGFRRYAPEVAEVKRLYVRPARRGAGYARQLLGELERRAVAAGYRRIVLYTGDRQPEALALYPSAGYRPTTPFGPYAEWPGCHFFAKDLAEP